MMRKLLALMLVATAASAQAGAVKGTVDKLWRLDCGTVHVNDLNVFSVDKAYTGQKRDLAASCYLIKDGAGYMLWDAGIPASAKNAPNDPAKPTSQTLRKTIVEQLAEIGVTPDQIGLIGISHMHGDHIGQAGDFPKAKLIIGAGDLAALRADPAKAPALAHWLTGGGKVEGVEGDKDIFQDGSVVMVALPGHTPGHHGLLVKLPKTGNVLLSGDVAHFHENLDSEGIPTFNTDRPASIEAMKRFRDLAAEKKAIAIIQHDPRDISKLPAFPKGAE